MGRLVLASLLLALAVDAFGFLPESITEVSDEYSTPNISFILFTRKNENGVEMFLDDKESIKKSGFNPKLPVLIATHGYLSDAYKDCVQELRKAYHSKSDVNFIAVDWSKYSKAILYEKAALAVKAVGLHVSKFLRFLTRETGLKAKDFHFLGHSLGAHVASFASNSFTDEKIGRITGLDPAAPLMEKLPPEDRLDPKDAHVVDVIHTCIIYVGIRIPVGTIDFYPNGGIGQPGCSKNDLRCHHSMSYNFFAKAVRTGKDYTAVKCNSLKDALIENCDGETTLMGVGSKKSKPGIYHAKISEF